MEANGILIDSLAVPVPILFCSLPAFASYSFTPFPTPTLLTPPPTTIRILHKMHIVSLSYLTVTEHKKCAPKNSKINSNDFMRCIVSDVAHCVRADTDPIRARRIALPICHDIDLQSGHELYVVPLLDFIYISRKLQHSFLHST